jgi:hypothetical protein
MGHNFMNSVAAAAGSLALAIASTHAVAAAIVRHGGAHVTPVHSPKVHSSQHSIEIQDFNFGVKNPATRSGSSGAGKVRFNPTTITTRPTVCRHCPGLIVPPTK